ncbi:DUF2975 family protein [Kribbella steppae]|uniref:DUF2975 family protein n=1 Tax=Kribbella steppae TaxID=2512223 RepID=A0A4R2GTT4_9ACTN|nr:DUF2975 domain-containing protein [Kribbella steppae]TCO13146.1 DUF2975 family protein [Kribbella steppae]
MRVPQSIVNLGRWSRTDALVLQGLLGIVFVVQAILGMVIPLLGVVGVLDLASSREVPVTGVAAPEFPDADGVQLSASGSAALTVDDPSFSQRVLLELPTIVGAVLILLGIYLLFRIARTLCLGDPFQPRNPLRLFGIAILIAVGSVAASLLQAVTTDQLVAGTPLADHVPFSVEFSLLPLLVALLVAALAEAFRIGVRLREDTEGLV